ncbi:MAG: DUF4303 domain-containing protein [Neisseria animaloris]|nr:DUF4303 domain-containing protein [Neisseria animaloris]
MNYSDDIFEKLVSTIEEATNKAAIDLFNSTKETFYFFVLSTTGEALAPYISAWSHEALQQQIITQNRDSDDIADFRWSSIDSPYFEFGSQYFHQVNQAFLERPDIHALETEVKYEKEFNFRIDAMMEALHRCDEKGIFSLNQARSEIMINVEILPPDYTNTIRAKKLNPSEAIQAWLKEAAEPME